MLRRYPKEDNQKISETFGSCTRRYIVLCYIEAWS
jgi:hypothetical protein